MGELRPYLRIARKWWWLVIVGTLVAAGTGFAVSTMLPPVYRASASLLVKIDSTNFFAIEQLTATYKELLTKRPVIVATARDLGLTPAQVEQRVQVHLIPETWLIELTAEADDPRLAMQIANGMVTSFMQISREWGDVRGRNLVVVESAPQPLRPASPNRILNTLIAAIVGFLLAAGAAFIIEYLDDRLETAEDVRQSLSLSTLALVPYPNGRRRRGDMRVTVEDPGSPLTEAYRTLRTRIQLSRADGTPLSLLVASPSSRDEQVKVVANLGAVMAQAGLRVLLVDADLRQPQLHRIFDLDREPGLSALTAMEAGDCQQYLAETRVPNLCLLSSGSPASDPLGLLGSKRMLRLIEVFKAQADVVLFNAPPILTVADAMVLASRVDGTLLVIGSRSTRRGVARRALAVLCSAGAEVWGVVLNGVRTGSFVSPHCTDFEEPGKHA